MEVLATPCVSFKEIWAISSKLAYLFWFISHILFIYFIWDFLVFLGWAMCACASWTNCDTIASSHPDTPNAETAGPETPNPEVGRIQF